MKFIRTEFEVPSVYTEQSRDFQLLCRLYSFIFNSTKYDVDNIEKITNSHEIRTNLLPLLQTKVGFFSNLKIEDTSLRLILEAFPLMVKYKGSLQAIEWALNVFLKILNLRVSVIITKTESETQFYNMHLPDHTIVIGLNAAFQSNANAFGEMLRYILPAGFGYYMYFYTTVQEVLDLVEQDTVAVIYASDDINAQIRSGRVDFNIEDRTLGNVSQMEVYSIGDIDSNRKQIDIIKDDITIKEEDSND